MFMSFEVGPSPRRRSRRSTCVGDAGPPFGRGLGDDDDAVADLSPAGRMTTVKSSPGGRGEVARAEGQVARGGSQFGRAAGSVACSWSTPSMHPRCAGARQLHPSMITSSSGRAVAASPVSSSLASVTSSQHPRTPRQALLPRRRERRAPTAAGPTSCGPDELSPRRLASPTPSQTARAAARTLRAAHSSTVVAFLGGGTTRLRVVWVPACARDPHTHECYSPRAFVSTAPSGRLPASAAGLEETFARIEYSITRSRDRSRPRVVPALRLLTPLRCPSPTPARDTRARVANLHAPGPRQRVHTMAVRETRPEAVHRISSPCTRYSPFSLSPLNARWRNWC